MKKFIFIALLFASSLFAAAQPNAVMISETQFAEKQTGDFDQELLRLNQNYAEAVKKSDTAALSRIFADDYAGIGFSGQPTSKAAMTASNNTPAATLIFYEEDDVKVRVFGETAVVTSRAALKTQLNNGRVISRRNALTKIWVKRGETWQIIATHMDAMPPLMPPLEISNQTIPKMVSPWKSFGKVEQEVLEAHLNYLIQKTGAEEAQKRFAPGYFTITGTGVVTDREEIIQRLKEETQPAVNQAAPSIEVVREESRILLRSNNGILVMDEFRSEAHGDTAAISYRATNYNRNNQALGQSRIGAVYAKKSGFWQQIFGQSTEIIAESMR